jgi:hypothetical protein
MPHTECTCAGCLLSSKACVSHQPHSRFGPCIWSICAAVGWRNEPVAHLTSPPSQAEASEFESLVEEAAAQPLLADLWVATDMASVADSEQFFLFEEILRWVGRCWRV